MDGTSDKSGLPVPVDTGIEASAGWLAERFPQVVLSIGPPPADFWPVADAWSGDSSFFNRLLGYQSRFATGMDARTKGAHLVSFYSHHLSIAAGAVYLRTGLVPDFGPECFTLQFKPVDRDAADISARKLRLDASRFHFHFGRYLPSTDAALLFHDLLVESLAPVISALQQRTGLSPVAQWRLVADGVAGAFLELGTALCNEDRAMAAALAILAKDGSPLSSAALRYERVGGFRNGVPVECFFRLRSGCCLYYRTDGGDFCDVCVLLDDDTKRGRLRALVEHTGGLR